MSMTPLESWLFVSAVASPVAFVVWRWWKHDLLLAEGESRTPIPEEER